MGFYRDSVTDLSWQLLVRMKKKHDFTLIGGWAVWLYTKALKSKDIDIVVGLAELSRLKTDYDLVKNNRLKKYEFRQNEVSVDVYSEHYSFLGIEAEKILTDSRTVTGFKLPSAELLLGLKTFAWQNRRGSAKGRKDFLDIVSLLNLGLDKRKLAFPTFGELIKEINLTNELPELNLNRHIFSRKKKLWLEVLK